MKKLHLNPICSSSRTRRVLSPVSEGRTQQRDVNQGVLGRVLDPSLLSPGLCSLNPCALLASAHAQGEQWDPAPWVKAARYLCCLSPTFAPRGKKLPGLWCDVHVSL